MRLHCPPRLVLKQRRNAAESDPDDQHLLAVHLIAMLYSRTAYRPGCGRGGRPDHATVLSFWRHRQYDGSDGDLRET